MYVPVSGMSFFGLRRVIAAIFYLCS